MFCRVMLVVEFNRASTKYASGAMPVLVIVTGTVTGVPAASTVLLLFGRPDSGDTHGVELDVAAEGLEISLPTTGSAKSTISVQVPGAGLRVYADNDLRAVLPRLFCPKPSAAPSGPMR